jgi:DNA-binding phage protein
MFVSQWDTEPMLSILQMGPRTLKLINQLEAYCNSGRGRRSRVARTLGLQRQTLTHWFSNRKNPTSEQILMIQELLLSLQTEHPALPQAITIFDGTRVHQCVSLMEAVGVAKAWYSDLANPKLPEWNYRIRDFGDFAKAVEDYKSRIAEMLGFGKNYRSKLGLAVLQTPVLSRDTLAHHS